MAGRRLFSKILWNFDRHPAAGGIGNPSAVGPVLELNSV